MAERSRAHLALGNAIKRARLRRGLSQEELGHRSSTHRTYITGVEGGSRNPSYSKLTSFAAALEMPLSKLLADAEKGEKSDAP
jgi:transcriptional regulator with XRE-family HTH domain